MHAKKAFINEKILGKLFLCRLAMDSLFFLTVEKATCLDFEMSSFSPNLSPVYVHRDVYPSRLILISLMLEI